MHQQLTYLVREHDKSYIYIYVIISQQSFTLIKNEIKLIVHLEYKHQIYMYFRKKPHKCNRCMQNWTSNKSRSILPTMV